MTKHQKRLSVPKSWPVERKTEKFTVKADAGPHGEDGVPLVVLLRDVLGYVDNTKEARYAINQGAVLVNGQRVGDEGRPIGMFDILSFEERGEQFRVFPDEGGRLSLTSIDEDAAGSRLGKVVGKQTVAGGDVQLTLHDGATLLVDDADYSPKDSLVVGNDDGEIVAHFPYEEGALVTAVRGQHAGRIGEIDEIQVTPGSGDNRVVVDGLDGESFETIEEYVVVIDENFVEDDEAASEEDDSDAAEAAEDDAEAEAAAEDDDSDAEASEDDAVAADDADAADAAEDDTDADAAAEDDTDAADAAEDEEAADDGGDDE